MDPGVPVLGRSYLMSDAVPADVKLSMAASFAAFIADCGEGVTADTIVGYLSHVRLWHIEHGHPDAWPTGLPLGQRVILEVRRVGKAPRGPHQATTSPCTAHAPEDVGLFAATGRRCGARGHGPPGLLRDAASQ